MSSFSRERRTIRSWRGAVPQPWTRSRRARANGVAFPTPAPAAEPVAKRDVAARVRASTACALSRVTTACLAMLVHTFVCADSHVIMNTDTQLAVTGSRVKVEEAGTGRRVALELVEAGKNLAERIAARLGREDQAVRIFTRDGYEVEANDVQPGEELVVTLGGDAFTPPVGGASDAPAQRLKYIRAVLAAVTIPVVISDDNMLIMACNEAALVELEYSEQDLVGRPIEILMLNNDPHRAKHASYVASYKATGVANVMGIHGREVFMCTSAGSPLPVRFSVSHVRGLSLFVASFFPRHHELALLELDRDHTNLLASMGQSRLGPSVPAPIVAAAVDNCTSPSFGRARYSLPGPPAPPFQLEEHPMSHPHHPVERQSPTEQPAQGQGGPSGSSAAAPSTRTDLFKYPGGRLGFEWRGHPNFLRVHGCAHGSASEGGSESDGLTHLSAGTNKEMGL